MAAEKLKTFKVYKAVERAEAHGCEVAQAFDKFGDLIPPAEFAPEIGACTATVRSMIKRGELPGVRIGQRLYIVKARLLEQLGFEAVV